MSAKMIENYGTAVTKVTTLFGAAILSISMSTTASAQKFYSLVANPFVFCSAPKPCKYCQPWRAIYQEICANQVNSQNTKKYEPSISTEFVDAVSAGSVQDGANQCVSRVAAVNEDLNLERTVDGLDVLNGPSGARPVEGLQLIR
jgi:hypothetical protein